MAHLCSLFNLKLSPRTPISPRTNDLVEVQNRNLATQLRPTLQNPPTNWPFQTPMYAYAHTTLFFCKLNFLHTIFFQTHPRIPLTFSFHLVRDSSKNCIATYCNSLSPRTHHSDQDLNPPLHSLFNKRISLWLLSAEHAMLEKKSTVHHHITNK